MLLAALLAMQAPPQSAAERDADALRALLGGSWNDAETAYFAAPPTAPRHLTIGAEGEGFSVRGDAAGLDGLVVQAEGEAVRVLTSGARSPCMLAAFRVGEAFRLDAEGSCPGTVPTLVAADTLALSDGAVMRRADAYACWVSRKKDAEGWTWTPDLTLREGETTALPDEAGVTRPAALRLRHVRWPSGPNRDSLVLYVHEETDAPAVSYAWTAPDADRIAINLRWVQASCTRKDEETER